MAAPADVRPRRRPAADARAARLAERGPGAGWRIIAAKELADHLSSVRFFVLLVVIGTAALVPLYFTSQLIRDAAPDATGTPAVFLLLFTVGPEILGDIPLVGLVALLLPLLGIAFGFDAINSERAQGTLPRLLSQPIHRDDVINGKFVAGIGVIALTLLAIVLLITGVGMARLGIVPSPDELARIVAWMLVTILYAGFWLAFALVLSVAIRRAASAALVGFGAWFGLVFLGSLFIPLVARTLFPIPATGLEAQFAAQGAQELFLRLFPPQLYQDVLRAILDPTATYTLLPGTLEGAQQASEQLSDTLLTLDQSLLLAMPQIIGLLALTIATFAIAYVLFLRQEVRA